MLWGMQKWSAPCRSKDLTSSPHTLSAENCGSGRGGEGCIATVWNSLSSMVDAAPRCPLWLTSGKLKGRPIAALSSLACWGVLAQLLGSGSCSPMAVEFTERVHEQSTTRTTASLRDYRRLNIVQPLHGPSGDVTLCQKCHFSHECSPFFPYAELVGRLCKMPRLFVGSAWVGFPLCVQSWGPTEGYPNSSVVWAGVFDVYLRSVHVTVFEVSPDTAYAFVAATALQITAGGLV